MNPPVIVVPSYWTVCDLRIKEEVVYDHPTDLRSDEETLTTLLSSLKILRNPFRVVVIGALTNSNLGREMDTRLRKLLAPFGKDLDLYCFSAELLDQLNRATMARGIEPRLSFSNLGYSNVRNLCLVAPLLLDAEVAVFLDDDEIVVDPEFLDKATEHVGKIYNGTLVMAVAGYYTDATGDFRLDGSPHLWHLCWNKTQDMNEAFQIIAERPRLKRTNFVFGGNMVLYRDLMLQVPFDPYVPRGEDIDYLVNARYYGYPFYLDRELSIVHKQPPSRSTPERGFHQDVLRFIYEREKIRLFGFTAEEFGPYPGRYLTEDLESRILLTSILMSTELYKDELCALRSFDEMWGFLKRHAPPLDEARQLAKVQAKKYPAYKEKWSKFIKMLIEDKDCQDLMKGARI